MFDPFWHVKGGQMTDIERQIMRHVGPRGLLLARELARRARWSPRYRRNTRVVWGWFQGPTKDGRENMAELLGVDTRTVRRDLDALQQCDVNLSEYGIAAPVTAVYRQRPYSPGSSGQVRERGGTMRGHRSPRHPAVAG